MFYAYRYWNKEIERKRRGAKAHLWWAIVKCFWWWILLHGVALFIQVQLLTEVAKISFKYSTSTVVVVLLY